MTSLTADQTRVDFRVDVPETDAQPNIVRLRVRPSRLSGDD
ncbi:MAG: hypothetical protein ACRDP1_15725 [Nocardioidaceae bacterium]